MSLKIKIILAAIIVLAVIVTIICAFVYVDHLNNKISDLNVTLTQQENEIKDLNCQIDLLEKNIDSLEKNVESVRETINVTNDYIESIEKAREDEMTTKEEIYETITSDPIAKDWYGEEIPQSLLEVLLRETDALQCN